MRSVVQRLFSATMIVAICSTLGITPANAQSAEDTSDLHFVVFDAQPSVVSPAGETRNLLVIPREAVSPVLNGTITTSSKLLEAGEVAELSTADSGIVPPQTLVPYEGFITEEIIIVDNDDEKTQLVAEYKWEEIPDEPGKTHIATGARFPVHMTSAVTSKTAQVGDLVEGRTKIDLKIGGRLVAPKGSLVVGRVTTVNKARKMLAAELMLNKRWMRPSGSLSFTFDEIITPAGEHLPLVAVPSRHARIINNTNEGRVLGVNHMNEIASPLSVQLKHQALHLAIRAGAAAGGVFSMGAVPVAYGVIGAINPSFAFMQPVGKNMRHRRLKGFALGVVTGMPGGFLVADSIIRGPEAVIKPGDVFHAEFKQDFTGEAATSAQLVPGATTKVHGERILDAKTNK